MSHCPPLLCSLNQGLYLIFPLQKPSCACLAGWEGPPYQHLQSSPPGRVHNAAVARQPGVRAAAQERAQGFLPPEGSKAYQGQRCLLPCQNPVTPGWSLISCLSRFRPHWKQEKRESEACPHALALEWMRIKYRNSPKIVFQVYARFCVTQENDYLSRAKVLYTHQPISSWKQPC